VTAAEIIAKARCTGASHDALPHEVVTVPEPIATAWAISERQLPTPCSPADYNFHIGPAGSDCLRCGVSWGKHGAPDGAT
jgi:hypothetical protein